MGATQHEVDDRRAIYLRNLADTAIALEDEAEAAREVRQKAEAAEKARLKRISGERLTAGRQRVKANARLGKACAALTESLTDVHRYAALELRLAGQMGDVGLGLSVPAISQRLSGLVGRAIAAVPAASSARYGVVTFHLVGNIPGKTPMAAVDLDKIEVGLADGKSGAPATRGKQSKLETE